MGAGTGHRVAKLLGRHPRSPRPAVALAAMLLLAACSSGDDSSSSDDERSTSDEGEEASVDSGSETTTTTSPGPEPGGTKPDEVAPYLRDLLRRYDEVVTKIVADPEVASDGDDPLVKEFLSLFEPGSDFAAGSLEGWQRYAGTGVTLMPLSAGEPVSETSIEGPMYTVDEDEVTFGHCTVLDYVLYRNGEEAERAERKLLPGNGRAVRLDGRWLLIDISTPPDIQGCLTKGGVTE